ncbi:methyltransferase family protein [Microbacterium sp. RD1]|uniref:methyltransferase family protein n=1 Tax=Microbacterium sp. RD1 TaxID=3457313 RepID=UPI003FA5F9EC
MLFGPLRFGLADASASRARHICATAVQIVLFWGLFLGVLPLLITALERRWMLSMTFPLAVVAAGAVVFAVATALGLWSAAVMSALGAGTPLPSRTATRFVIAGPYRFVRNPMAVAGIVQGLAVGAMLSSWLVVAYALCGSLVWNYAVRPLEEQDLETRFGEPHRLYRARVRCWWPRVHPVPAFISGTNGLA